MEEIIERVKKVQHGFKPFDQEAIKIIDSHTAQECKNIALGQLHSEFYQVRCLSVFILGYLAVKDRTCLEILKNQAQSDKSWQVQEIIAKAFDQYCKDNGYDNSLGEIEEWINDVHPNVCRAVTEGLRIWTGRPYFKDNPKKAIDLISVNKSNPSEYLRKSTGNSLRDIAKKYPDLITAEISNWDLSIPEIAFTYSYIKKTRAFVGK
jgi:3-methyladenine DNA glycosylase AlkC